ncbi:MAG: hypothetical protein J6O53_03425 [Eubacterium sp.]|nr:hypothetical protein [Eubacterium sp.]
MRRIFKKRSCKYPVIIGMAVAILGMNAGVVSAEEYESEPEEYAGGFIPVEKELYYVPQSHTTVSTLKAQKSYPDRYRSDEEPWAESIRVKDQEKSGICWAFATSSACEYSYAKELYETTGEVATVTELSPGHLAQFFFNRVVDPLGNTAGDMNALDSSYHWATSGGNQLYGMQHLAGWSGMASEGKTPMEKIFAHIKGSQWDGSIPPYSADLAYDNAVVLQESILLFQPDTETMKDLILKYGAFSMAMQYTTTYMNMKEVNPATGEPYSSGRSFYNTRMSPSYNHAVTAIGWDDHYPKENFRRETPGAYEGDPPIVREPEQDGAWIIQNSWGTDSNEDGIFYMSYESAEFENSNYIVAFDMQSVDAYQYNFYYDGTAGCADCSDRDSDGGYLDYYTTPKTSAANIFTNTTEHTIEIGAVGYTTFNLGLTNYDVSVYTGLTDPMDPESGTYKGTTRISSTLPGCKSAELDEKVKVAPGESFSIVFYFPDFTAFGTEIYRNSTFLFQPTITEGQSFFRQAASKTWKDLADYGACFRIKAFANTTEDSIDPPKPTGWQKETDGMWYHYTTDGTLSKGWLRYKAQWYYLDEDTGAMKTGWIRDNGCWYYLNPSGAMAKGWKKIGMVWYHFKTNGAMSSKEWISGYLLDSDGRWTYAARASWRKTRKGWWYGDTSGWYAKKQWQKIDGIWYYFDASGYIVTGRQVIDGKLYTFGGDGALIQ